MFKLINRHGRRSTIVNLFCDKKLEVRKTKIYYIYSRSAPVRYASTTPTDIGKTIPVLESIPEPPSAPDLSAITESVQSLAANGEPTFASLGLGGWSPVGLIQNGFEYLHISLDVPWWGVILIGTVCVRIALLPLVILSQRNAALMNNNLPEMQTLQLKMTQARQTGNQLEAARYGQEMVHFMKEKGLNPLKNMLPPIVQAPVFISFFISLRQMANCPVESLTTGGLFWFTDLTVPDQFFILPIITSATLWATIELGVDGARLDAQNMKLMKYVLRSLPIIMLPFTINFPGVILLYWCSSNFISLIQVGILKIPAIRDFFKIAPMVTHSKESLPIQRKGFIKDTKESWYNMKITKELEERQRIDELIFTKAGKVPIQKTYKYDPTKAMSSVQAKPK